jgi:membrane protein required for colicin V production
MPPDPAWDGSQPDVGDTGNQASTMPHNLIWADYFILGVLGLSSLIGLLRGFLKEAISLLTWISAFVIAFLFVEQGATYLAHYIGVPSVRIILAFSVLFICTLVLGGLINLIVALLVQRTGLSGTDRMLGIAFGLLRGVAIVATLVLLTGLTPLPQDPWWTQSPLLPHFQQAALWLRDFMPPNIAENFKFP